MLTDLLVAGLMVAATPNLPGPSESKPTIPEKHSEARTDAPACQPESHIALLEAHASFAAMPPFSLARLNSGTANPARNGPKEKDAGGCKS
jgi:hypothetical protein